MPDFKSQNISRIKEKKRRNNQVEFASLTLNSISLYILYIMAFYIFLILEL